MGRRSTKHLDTRGAASAEKLGPSFKRVTQGKRSRSAAQMAWVPLGPAWCHQLHPGATGSCLVPPGPAWCHGAGPGATGHPRTAGCLCLPLPSPSQRLRAFYGHSMALLAHVLGGCHGPWLVVGTMPHQAQVAVPARCPPRLRNVSRCRPSHGLAPRCPSGPQHQLLVPSPLQLCSQLAFAFVGCCKCFRTEGLRERGVY